ncbi:MAG: MarR family winged helix-turn-helix transcriptional regulator, partial [Acidimicrobiales bacterium]
SGVVSLIQNSLVCQNTCERKHHVFNIGCARNYSRLGTILGVGEPDPLEDERLTLAGLLFETAGAFGALAHRRLADAGLNAQWTQVLMRLARSPGHRLRMSDLAAQSTLTPSGLTRAVDRLEAAGLVERRACPTDRRGAFATLTPEGLRRIRSVLPDHLEDIEANLIAPLTNEERVALERALRKMRDHVHPMATAGGDGVTPPVMRAGC